MKVRATVPEMTTDTAMVMANCWYMRPAMPPVKATGMNTAHSTSTMAMTGPVTSCMALAVALRGGRPSLMCRSTFSSTTMASSTTMPMASTRPNMVRVLMENPSAYMPANVPTMDTGTARQGISVARQFWRNRYTTRNTSTMASNRVLTTSSMEILTKVVVS